MLKQKRPDIKIVGDEVHPLLKVTDFSPYIAKIKASGGAASSPAIGARTPRCC